MNDPRFSYFEREVLSIIGRKKLTIREITEEVYSEPNLEHANIVAGVVRRINRKCEDLDLPWFINGKGGGRGGKTVWREKR